MACICLFVVCMYLFICGLYAVAINSPDYALSNSIQVLLSHNIISLAQGPEGAGWLGAPFPQRTSGARLKRKTCFYLNTLT
jgi:hypothetical protein